MGADLFHQNFLYEFGITYFRKCFVERVNYQVVDTKFLKKIDFLIQSGQQAEVGFIGSSHQARVSAKREYNRFATMFSRNFAQAQNHLLMPQMHPIESPDGDHRSVGAKIC